MGFRNYKPGQEVYDAYSKIYHEGEAIFRVKILEDNSDASVYRYSLRVLKVIWEKSYLEKGTQEGVEIKVEQSRGALFGGMWSLSERL